MKLPFFFVIYEVMHSSKNSGNSSAQSLQPGFWFQCAEQTVWKNRADSRWEMKTFGWAVWFFSCREAAEAEKKINLQHPGPVSCWLLSPACVGVAIGLGGHWAPSDAVLWGLKATTERLCLRDRKEFYELNCTVRKEKGKFRAPFIPRSWKFKKRGFLLKALFEASQ